VNSNAGWEFTYSGDSRSILDRPSRSRPPPVARALSLNGGEALIVIVLLSLGLWGGIWLELSTLVAH
jgi:hypothetical protein